MFESSHNTRCSEVLSRCFALLYEYYYESLPIVKGEGGGLFTPDEMYVWVGEIRDESSWSYTYTYLVTLCFHAPCFPIPKTDRMAEGLF